MSSSSPVIPFFGRREELQRLRDRSLNPGLTIVTGQPRIGKSTLITRFAEELRASEEARVGIARGTNSDGDLIRRATRDAYESFVQLKEAKAHIKAILEQSKGRVSDGIFHAMGELAKAAGEDVPGGKTAGTAAKLLIDAVGGANKRLTEGAMAFAPLEVDQIKLLLSILDMPGKRPTVLILNQWEESSKLDHDRNVLSEYVQDIRNWPRVHIVLHVREPHRDGDLNADKYANAIAIAHELARFPAAETISLKEIDFSGVTSVEDADKLRDFLIQHVPGTQRMDEEEALELISGYPGVLEHWCEESTEDERSDPEWLRKAAQDAHAFRYPDLIREIEKLVPATGASDEDRRALRTVLRLALLPAIPNREVWEAVREQVMGDGSDELLIDLQSQRILQGDDDYPSFGHPTRHAAARARALDDHSCQESGIALKPHTRKAIDNLARALAVSSDVGRALDEGGPDETRLHLLAALIDDSVYSLLSLPSQSLVLSVTTLSGNSPLAWPELPDASLAVLDGLSATLYASGLVNAINYAEDNSERADSHVEQLQRLADRHPDDERVREYFADGLVNAINYAEDDLGRADRLVKQLQRLADLNPDDKLVREKLAEGLVNAISSAKNDTGRADCLVGQLQRLADRHSDDERVREELTKGLYNAISGAIDDRSRSRRFANQLHDTVLKRPLDPDLEDQLVYKLGGVARDALLANNLDRALIIARLFQSFRASISRQPKLEPLIRQMLLHMLDICTENDMAAESTEIVRISKSIFD